MTNFPPPLPLGSCFRFKSLREPHLWVVATDPATHPQALLVSVTTMHAWSDKACVIETGEHPFVVHRSCVSYAKARLVASRELVSLVANDKIEEYAKLSKELLDRVQWGAYLSQELPGRMREFFINYMADRAGREDSADP